MPHLQPFAIWLSNITPIGLVIAGSVGMSEWKVSHFSEKANHSGLARHTPYQTSFRHFSNGLPYLSGVLQTDRAIFLEKSIESLA